MIITDRAKEEINLKKVIRAGEFSQSDYETHANRNQLLLLRGTLNLNVQLHIPMFIPFTIRNRLCIDINKLEIM